MAFAFHSDAGTTYGDTIIGTLGIFQTSAYDGIYANGTSRYASRDLCDLIQSNIVKDIRTLHEPEWTRRGMWNQSYYEARVPRVPTDWIPVFVSPSAVPSTKECCNSSVPNIKWIMWYSLCPSIL